MGARAERPRNGIDGIHIVENFISNDLVADNTVGQQGWELQTIANLGTLALLTGAANQRPGGLRHTTAATADGDGMALQSNDDGITFKASVKGGGFAFAFRYPNVGGNQLAGNDFWVGVNTSITATAPTDGISVFGDAGVLTLYVDSNDHGDTTAAAAGVTTLTGGTTAVLDVIHYVEVIWTGENGQGGPRFVEMFIDNEPAGSALCNIDDDETAELKILHYQNTGGAADLEWDILFYEYWQWYDWPTAPAV